MRPTARGRFGWSDKPRPNSACGAGKAVWGRAPACKLRPAVSPRLPPGVMEPQQGYQFGIGVEERLWFPVALLRLGVSRVVENEVEHAGPVTHGVARAAKLKRSLPSRDSQNHRPFTKANVSLIRWKARP